MSTTAATCRICDASGPHPTHTAREMMLGLRDEFTYFECRACSTLQILDAPSSSAMSRYYQQDRYYSFRSGGAGRLQEALLLARTNHALGLGSPVGRLVSKVHRDDALEALREVGVDRSSRLLDVGCGGGNTLERLARAGFRSLLGIDPFLESDSRTASGVSLLKRDVRGVTGTFDVIMFHHSLEHVEDPVADLRAAAERLVAGGTCLVRVPTPSSVAWETYGTDWVQLDAPRHFVLPSRDGMKIAADKAGLVLDRVVDDSSAFQFLFSEQYRRDVPGTSSGRPGLMAAVPSRHGRAAARRARELNSQHRGDQAAFYLRKPAA